jgi:hypothetical protein
MNPSLYLRQKPSPATSRLFLRVLLGASFVVLPISAGSGAAGNGACGLNASDRDESRKE